MALVEPHLLHSSKMTSHLSKRNSYTGKPTNVNGLILEAWAQGFMVGSLVIMSAITLANMRRKVLLHKLILIELLFGLWQGFFIFFDEPIYGWWLSVGAIFLNASWVLHNFIAWIKNKPFFTKRISMLYVGTVILTIPYWVVEIYANFAYFHGVNNIFLHTRPYESLVRDPWWIFTTISLFYNIQTRYELSIIQIVRISPRFAVMLLAMLMSIAFLIVDILSVTSVLKNSLPVGINPFWKLSFVFKCLTDCVVLDDFKTALDRLRAFKISKMGSFALDVEGSPKLKQDEAPGNSWHDVRGPNPTMPSPDGDYISSGLRWEEAETEVKNQEKIRQAPLVLEKDKNQFPDHVAHHDYASSHGRDGSDAHILKSQSSWLRDSSGEDMDSYAAAMRQITRTSEEHGSSSHYDFEGSIGKAK